MTFDKMNPVQKLYTKLTRTRWELGLIHDGLDGAFSDKQLIVDWIENPFKDRWFADPFILDVTEEYVYILAEEYSFSERKGRIAKLWVNRKSMVIERFKILLETSTHLSFPSILRKNGKIYVYPESAYSGRLDLYQYERSATT